MLSKFTRDIRGGLIDEVNVARPDTPKTPLSPGHRKSSASSVSQSSGKEEHKVFKETRVDMLCPVIHYAKNCEVPYELAPSRVLTTVVSN